MARDADNNYYYDEGTIAEQFDEWDIYEDEDGNIGFYNGNGEVRLEELAYVLGGRRAAPSAGDLGADESLLFVDDADGGFKIAHSNDGTDLVLSVIVADVTA